MASSARILGSAYLVTASFLALAAGTADQAALHRAARVLAQKVRTEVAALTTPPPGGPVRLALAAAPLTPAPEAVAQAGLEASLTPELRQDFALFLYVSKAPPQRLYAFRKTDNGLTLLYDWPASTGRARAEVTPAGRRVLTDTPEGLYQLDPARLYADYRSHSWDQPMPHAMFFDWVRHGQKTGLAIHAAMGADIAKLGRPASAGCVHLSPDHARILFDLVRSEYRGAVPRFAYDPATRSTSNNGALMRDADGRPVMAEGYKVLVVIADPDQPRRNS